MTSTNSTQFLRIFFCAFGVSTLSLARNDGFSRDSGSGSGGWGADSRGVSRGSAPAAPAAPRVTVPAAPSAVRSFSPPDISTRSLPAPAITPRTFQAPAVQTAPAARSGGAFYSGGAPSVSPPPVPAYSAPRVSADSSPRFPATLPARQTPVMPSLPARSAAAPTVQPAERVRAPAVQRTLPEIQTVTPHITPQPDNARSFGTARAPAPAAQSPVVTAPAPARTLTDRGSRSLPRVDVDIPRETARISEATRSAASAREPAAAQPQPLRQADRTASFLPRDATTGRLTAPRLGANDLRLDRAPGSASPHVSPMRFGTSGFRSPAANGDAAALPSALSLRAPRGDADTDRFGRAALPRMTMPTLSARENLSRAYPPARDGASRHGENNALYRPPYGAPGERGQPFNRPPPSAYGQPRGGSHRHGDGHHDDHHDHHPYYGPWYGPYACSPVWWGPVVYPAASSLTCHSVSFALSFATYAPACHYTRYYDSWCGGGWGYTGVYYGGWRSGWYGGFSYVYNPWPAYRTYYFYEPYPVTETIYVTQPAATTVYVTQPATATVVAEPAAAPPAYAAAPSTAYAASPSGYAAAPSGPAPTAWDAAPAVQRTEAAATTCFCPCRCDGLRPCTCAYPCGSEYALRDADLDLSQAFASYSETLSAEMIWSSYAGLDRWDTQADAYENAAVVTAGGNER